ncbi:MAG: 1,4-alpha-glucan branching protein GlgB [archaeon]
MAIEKLLDEQDLYYLKEGTDIRAFDKLGCNHAKIDGKEGYHFAVWAPSGEVEGVSLIGDFNNWQIAKDWMHRLGSSGVHRIFVPDAKENQNYKFAIHLKNGTVLQKADPYAFLFENPPSQHSASTIVNLENYLWNDENWMQKRQDTQKQDKPLSIYEAHLGSWKRKQNNEFLNYKEIADELIPYVKDKGFTHIELLPILEHPFYGSWGYQVMGFYAPTSRYGSPNNLRYLIDKAHQNEIGVILDWVPGHFANNPKNELSELLSKFDGSYCYEHEDKKKGEHFKWGTKIFNYSRNEVQSFLLSNVNFWADKYHVDGFRVDAVASMIYLDYERENGAWVPNRYGGKENLEAIDFLIKMNRIAHDKKLHKGLITIAEESTDFAGITKPIDQWGGIGFDYKWNMGWMHDSLEYSAKEPIHRRYHHNQKTFSIMYKDSEKFILPLSHDEFVCLKKSLVKKMPGDDWQKFANARLLLSDMYAHPGKKLLFQGTELGQWEEWNHDESLPWHLLEHKNHKGMQNLVKDLNSILKNTPALHEVDCDYWENDRMIRGFEWINCNDADFSIISFYRQNKNEDNKIIFVGNYTPVIREKYPINVPERGVYQEILNTDEERYWGSGVKNSKELFSKEGVYGPYLEITAPPLAGLYLKKIK